VALFHLSDSLYVNVFECSDGDPNIMQPAPTDSEASIASKTMLRIGTQLLNDSKQAATKSEKDKKSWEGRDILSLLVRANIMPGVPKSQRLNDDEVLARELQTYLSFLNMHLLTAQMTTEIPTFMVAGHETTRYESLTVTTRHTLTLQPQRCCNMVLVCTYPEYERSEQTSRRVRDRING
jgi:hypothetical protein